MQLDTSARAARRWPRAVLERAGRFGRSVAAAPHREGGLLAVGAGYEPWHLVAHLEDAARWSGARTLAPQLVRRDVPDGAPPHLAVGLERLARAGRGETVLVVAAELPDPELLERLADARRRGGTVLALEADPSADLASVAHETADVGLPLFEPAMHVVPLGAVGMLQAPRRVLLGRRRRAA